MCRMSHVQTKRRAGIAQVQKTCGCGGNEALTFVPPHLLLALAALLLDASAGLQAQLAQLAGELPLAEPTRHVLC